MPGYPLTMQTYVSFPSLDRGGTSGRVGVGHVGSVGDGIDAGSSVGGVLGQWHRGTHGSTPGPMGALWVAWTDMEQKGLSMAWIDH